MSSSPDPKFGSARAVIVAAFTGKLRDRFLADLRQLGDDAAAIRKVAAGYLCLLVAVGWAVGLVSIVSARPDKLAGVAASILNIALCVHGFKELEHRRNPLRILNWLLLLFIGSAAMFSLQNAGIVAPGMTAMPVAIGASIIFQDGVRRWGTLAFAALSLAVSFGAALGVIGTPTPYTPEQQTLVDFITVGFTSLLLGCLAYLAGLMREATLMRIRDANTEMIESAARSRVALEAARVGLWDVADMDAPRFHVSDSFQSVTGYTGEEFNVLWATPKRVVHPEDLPRLLETFAESRAKLARVRVDFRLMTRTRGYRWFAARARPAQNADGSISVSGSLQDINFVKAAEDALREGRDQAREANKAKSDFIATMSHEVRTPLNAILGSVAALKRGTHDGETTELIELIDDAGRGLFTIVSDMLDVSKIEAGKLDIVPEPADVSALVKRTVDIWRPRAVEKGLVISAECSGAHADNLLVDTARVRQVLGNLLSNAIKFTDAGSVTARLSTHEQADGRVRIDLSVTDTGGGVPDDVAARIFKAFEQGPSGGDRGGTGLGLFISRRLATMMGGELTLERGDAGGACFRLVLVADRSSAQAGATPADTAEQHWENGRVLVVDDNENNRRIAEILLGKLGLEVTLSASGAEALDLCAMQEFDVVLMDIVMPEMDGFETLRRLREDDHGLNCQTPVIALTARLASEDLAAYQAAGFKAVAAKPINIRELAMAMQPYLKPAEG